MPESLTVPVKDLKLDLKNYRTVPQASEAKAVEAMILISPDRFWALMESLIETGYLPTENIIVLKTGTKKIVREGNRRIAALKLIRGDIASSNIIIPDHLTRLINGLSNEWKNDNLEVPCTIYDAADAGLVDRIVTLAHGKGEKAGRDGWSAVARARHNRDVKGLAEPALDILEKYLKNGKNVTPLLGERWAGDYPLSVLDEAIKKTSTRFGSTSAPDLAKSYPTIQHRAALELIMHDIGVAIIGFRHLRSKTVDFAAKYGLVPAPAAGSANPPGGAPGNAGVGTGVQTSGSGTAQATTPTGVKIAAVAIQDPKAVLRALKSLKILGDSRSKVVSLRDEALWLKLDKNPIAFCFLLRSMFELSAKAYCADHKSTGGPSVTYHKGPEKSLKDLLEDVVNHLINNNPDKASQEAMRKVLHGASTELAKREGLLSVYSMNALVHNPNFAITAGDISTVFGNVFTLLEVMNQ